MAYVPVSMRQKPQEAQTKVTTVKTGGYKPVAERKAKNKEVLDSIKKSTPFMLPNLNRILTAPNKPYIPSIPVGGTANSTQAIADKNTPDTVKMVKGTANLITGLNPLDKDVREGFVQGVPQAVSGFQQGAGNLLDTIAENAGGKSKEAQFFQKGADSLKRKADENYKLGKDISTDFSAKGITPLLQDADFAKAFWEDKEFAKRMMDKYATEEEKTGNTKSFLELIQDPSVAQKMVAKNLPNLVIGAGTGLATTIATGGNVPAGVASAFAVTGTMEGGNAINEAKEFLNKHPDQAFRDLAKDEDYLKNIGTAVGIINGALEVLPIANLLKRIPAGNEVKSRVARIVLNRLIVGGLTQSALEGGTETIQELVGNAVKQVYDADQGLFEGVGEAGILGAVTGGGVSLATDVGISGYDKSKALKAYYDTLSPKEKQGGFINFGIGLGDKSSKPKFGGFIDPRNKAEAFVTAVKGDKQVYFTVPKGQEASVIDAIDGTSNKGIAGKEMADGWTYHITANPQRVKEVYRNKGKITLGQINALKRKSGIVLDSEMDQTQQRIVENISKDEVEQLLKRAYPFVSDFYDSFEDWMEQDSNTIDLEIESNDITLMRRSEKLRERAEVPDGKGYRGDVSLSEIIDLYKEGKLTKSTANLDAPRRTDIKTDSSVQPTLTQPFSPKVDSTVAVESLKQLYNTANQRVASSNREAVQKARLDLFVQYNANPNLASELGVTPAELNKKIRTMAGFPASGSSVQRDLNQGVAPQYQWIGISNSSYITKQSLQAESVDPMVKKVTDKTAKWGQPDGKMLRDYILRTMFAIDTRISYADLTFKVESLERALGQYNNQRIEITINTGSSNTVAHEIGHYLDYKWAREIGFDNSLTELTQAGFNKKLIQEQYNLSDEHMAWVESFKDFSYRLSNVSDLGRDNKSASYRQNPTETFARFVDKFVQWTNKQAGVREWAESGYYDDKFTESQFREFVTLLQEKAFLDAKYSIKYDPRVAGKPARKPKDTKSKDSILSEDESIQGSDTTRSEVIGYVREKIQELINNDEIDNIEIEDIRVIGSRTTGKARKDSDLDVVVQYKGDMREDDLFNALNEDPLEVDGFTVDINPISADKTGTIDEFLGINKQEVTNEYATNPDQTFYHGTLADFDKFDSKQAGKNTEWDNAKFGIFFIDDKARAEQFIEDARTAGDTRTAKVKEVQLNIKNPLDLTVKGITTKASQAKFLYEMLWGEAEAKPNLTNEEALAELDDAIDLDTISELHDGLYGDIENKQKMIDAGYDGIVSVFGRDNGKTILEYVAFNDSQIKIKSPRSKGSDIGEAPEGWKETNQVARERFDIPNLEKISFGGSDRDVYKLEGNKVLKVAKSARGLAQNRVALDWYAQSQGLIPKVFEAGDNYIVSEFVGKPDARTKELVKILREKFLAKRSPYQMPEALNETAEVYYQKGEDDLATFITEFANWDLMTGDLIAIRNWGTTKDGDPILIDEGTLSLSVVKDYTERSNLGVPYTLRKKKDMSDPEFVGVYNRSKTARKNYGDTDGKTKYSEAPTIDPAIFKKRFTELTEEEKNQVLEAGNNKGLSEELQMRAYLIEQKQEAIENSVYKQLLKYKVPNRKNINKVFKNFRGRLPEVTGFAYAQINNVKELPYMEFMRAGDEIVGTTEFEGAGITDTEQAREGFDKWLSDLEDLRQMKREFMTEKRQYIEKRNINEAMVTQIRKRVRDERRGAKIEGKRIRSRQKEVKAYINALNLEPAEKRKIQGNRSIDLMKEAEYEEFLDALEQEARKIQDKRQAKNELEFTIFDKGLSKVENLQKALKLPTITNMTAQQLRDFDELLQQYKTGDEFLTVRQIETVDNTDLKGIKTLREARERLAVDVSKVWKETVTGDDLKNIKVAPVADRIAYDADLATKNPFYALMVNEWNKAYVKAEANYYATEKKINELTKKARASRKRSLADKLIPTDKVVFQYMETPDADKAKYAKDNKMTPEEMALADFMKKDYEVKRDYLVQMEVLKHYRQDYITHIRRGFLETWKEDNLITAFKELFEQYQQDEAVFNIMDGETGNILPLEKFFKYSMKRTGGLKPTNNVASAFLSYDKQFQKKLMLDSIVPKLDIYAHSITPKNKTPKGLEMDKTIRNFMTEWINTKKGRTTSRMALPQGSRSDIILRGLNGFLTIIDLGLNIPVGIASQFGEQISTYQALGTKGYSKGVVRLNSEKGKAFVKKHESFIGRSPWEELFDSTNTIGDQTLDAMFILFRDATIRANKIFTLGALTKEEYESGEISTERLAEIRNLMSTVRVVDEAKSIYGSTSVGGVFTKYKTWAIPHLLTTRRNIINLIRQFREKGVTDIQKSPEAQQLLRMIMVTGTIAVVVGSAIDDDDDSFTGRLLRKAYQDSMTQMGSLDPAVIMSVPRLLTFLEDVGTAISEIIRLEEYKSGEKKGTLKGDNKLYNTLSPALVDQITKSVTEDNASTTDQVNQVKTKGTSGMPAVPKKKSEKRNLPPIPKSSQK